jgi:hypothetical protein
MNRPPAMIATTEYISVGSEPLVHGALGPGDTTESVEPSRLLNPNPRLFKGSDARRAKNQRAEAYVAGKLERDD